MAQLVEHHLAGETFAITRADRNVVFELDGQPALKRVEELYTTATERDQLLMRRGLHVGQATTELKPELGRGDFVIRNLVGVDRDTGAIAISDMAEVGQTVQFQVRDAESAREDLARCSSPNVPIRWLARCCSSATVAANGSDSRITTSVRSGAPLATFRSRDSSRRASPAQLRAATSYTGSPLGSSFFETEANRNSRRRVSLGA